MFKGLAAMFGTAAIVIGVPLGLLTAFGTPWPSEAPTLEWLTSPTTGEALLAVLAVVVWLAWAHFVVCLTVEAVAERRQRGMAVHVPGGGVGTQYLARRLIATMVLVAGTAGAGMSTANAATASGADQSAQPATTQLATAQLDAVEASAADTGAADDASRPAVSDLDAATETDQKQGAVTYYDVKPPNNRNYDTLWDIADRYLGDGLRYKEIWELNKDIVQPDGRALRDANLIHPGWVMRMPDDARGPGLKVVDHADGASRSPDSTVAEQPGGSDEAGAAGQEATSADEPAAAATTSGAESASQSQTSTWAPLFGVAGGLALAGAFLALRRRRASSTSGQLWARRSLRPQGPHGPQGPDDPHDPDDTPPQGSGARLRDEADVSTASWLDRAVRQLGGGPAPARAAVSSAGLAVVFDADPETEAPAGWTSATNRLWTVDRSLDWDLDGTLPTKHGLSPLPGLVSVGRRDDGSIQLVDVESAGGIVAIDGDDHVARALALSVAVDTATHPWADRRSVTLVNFADDLTAIGDGNIKHVDDITRVLDSLDNVAGYQRDACRRAGADDVRAARAHDAVDDWTYQLVVCSGVPAPAELARLQAHAEDRQTAIGVVIIGSAPSATMKLTARADGRVVSPLYGIDAVAQQLTVGAASALVELYEPTAAARNVSLSQLIDAMHGEAGVAAYPHADPDRAIPSQAAHISVLGTIEVNAPGTVDPHRQDFLTELACYIAMHPQGVHINRIGAALWPRGVEPQVRDSAMGQLKEWFTAPEDTASLILEESGVWRFLPDAVATDWEIFSGALNRAADEGTLRETHLRAALALVRGPSFADAPHDRYAWLENLSTVSDMALAVSLTAQSLAESAMGRGDESGARSALDSGLAMLPANEELWRSMLRLTEHFADSDAVAQTADQMYQAIADYGSQLGAEPATDALVTDLLPGYHAQVA